MPFFNASTVLLSDSCDCVAAVFCLEFRRRNAHWALLLCHLHHFRDGSLSLRSMPSRNPVRLPSRFTGLTKSRALARLLVNGAGDGNRTRLYSLGSCRSTDELRPQGAKTLSQYLTHAVSAKIAGGGSHVISEIYAGNGTPCSFFISSALLRDGSFSVWCFTD